MPTIKTATKAIKDNHIATVTRQGAKATYTCDCGKPFTGSEDGAYSQWSKHVAANR